jgi:outer membrane lipoprotein SlyB
LNVSNLFLSEIFDAEYLWIGCCPTNIFASDYYGRSQAKETIHIPYEQLADTSVKIVNSETKLFQMPTHLVD